LESSKIPGSLSEIDKKRRQLSMLIRWLFAFRRPPERISLLSCLEFEMERRDECAAENIPHGCNPIVHSKVGIGLLFSQKQVSRKFSYDCWSEKDKASGLLSPCRTRHGRSPFSKHGEAFVHGVPEAIIIDRPWHNMPGKRRDAIRKIVHKYGIPVRLWKKGRLEEVVVV
jgi:hypothetical protein